MDIAGGLYREVCVIPDWNAEFGSGGRAAAAVSNLSPNSTLHTYIPERDSSGVLELKNLGISVQGPISSMGIAFAYFHPLSRPHIEPPSTQIIRQPPLHVSGNAVLRFGFLEGEAIVSAERAVYDPQTSSSPQPFSANGSNAGTLAIVLNELELRSMSGESDLSTAAEHVMRVQNASVIVAKIGTRGALVFDRDRGRTHIPAYHSSAVFKIGTGDIFSSIFAFYWAEEKLSAHEAADLASRTVASYCSTRQLPVPPKAISGLVAVRKASPGPILLEGEINTMGRRYVMEEARFRLHEIGATVISTVLDGVDLDTTSQTPAAVLIVADTITPTLRAKGQRAHKLGLPVIILAEACIDPAFANLSGPNFTITNDFVSALYFSVWAAIPIGINETI